MAPSATVGVFETLADPTRRRILQELRAGERSVGDLVAAVDIHQPGVSRHLRILGEAGFVSVRPEGQKRLYRLREEPFDELERWLADYKRALAENFERLDAVLARMQEEEDRREAP